MDITSQTTDELTRRPPLQAKILNPIVSRLLRMGINIFPVPMVLLTVQGRKTGKAYTSPVGLFEWNGHRYLFSTFGESSWVRNLRSRGVATLTHGKTKEMVTANEISRDEAAATLKGAFAPLFRSRFVRRNLRSQYHVTPDTPSNEYLNVAAIHPVFEVLSREIDSPSNNGGVLRTRTQVLE